MDSADPEAQVKPALPAALDLSALKAAGTFLGIIGSGGGGFAALSFGIGYLAIKKHDELIGLPTTVADPTSYIRSGALFFPSSAFFLVAAMYKLLALALLALLLVLLLLAVARFRRHRSRRSRPAAAVAAKPPSPGWILATAVIVLLALALYTLSLQTAAFDPQNRNLLYKVISDREARLAQMFQGSPATRQPANVTSVLAWPPWQQSLARRINALLRHPQGRGALQVFYGQQLALVLVVLYCVVVYSLKRKRWLARMEPLDDTSRKPYRIVQGLTPFVYLVTLALTLNLPSVYGVLCLPTSSAWVHVVSTTGPNGEKDTAKGTLLSDLSGSGKEIWLLDESQSKFVLIVLDRSKVSAIKLTGEVDDNFLSIENPTQP